MIFRIALILAIPVLSLIFSLMSSGIENILTADSPDWKTTPLYYWLAFWAVAWFTIYQVRFGSTKRLKMFVLRLAIRARIKYLASHVVARIDQPGVMQKRAMTVWAQLLRDRRTTLESCLITGRRMLRKDGMTCIVTTDTDVNFMFIRSGDKGVYFDVYLPHSIVSSMFASFDKEQRLRFDRVLELAREMMASSVAVEE